MLLLSKQLEKSLLTSSVFVVPCMQTGVVLKDWKQANIIPMYKREVAKILQTIGQHLLPALYVCKLFEKIINPHTMKHLESHDIRMATE